MTLLNETDAAKLLTVRCRTLRYWRKERRGPRYFRVGRAVRYEQIDLEAWLAQQAAAPDGTRQAVVVTEASHD